MVTQFDEKGKIFTPIVSKKKMEVVVQTTTHRMIGFLHIHPETRVKDELDKSPQFIALTDARVIDENGKDLYLTNFLVFNRDQVIWIIPVSEMKSLSEKI
jgi:hypothetical protein